MIPHLFPALQNSEESLSIIIGVAVAVVVAFILFLVLAVFIPALVCTKCKGRSEFLQSEGERERESVPVWLFRPRPARDTTLP